MDRCSEGCDGMGLASGERTPLSETIGAMLRAESDGWTRRAESYALEAAALGGSEHSDVRRILAARSKREAKNARARRRRSLLRDVADSLGMSVVRGSVSGRLYLE